MLNLSVARNVVRVLPAQYASEVRDIILSPPAHPYTAIKEALEKRVCPTHRRQLQQLHAYYTSKTSATESHHNSCVICWNSDADAIFRQLFLDKLPLTIRTALAIHNGESLENPCGKWRTPWPSSKAPRRRAWIKWPSWSARWNRQKLLEYLKFAKS